MFELVKLDTQAWLVGRQLVRPRFSGKQGHLSQRCRLREPRAGLLTPRLLRVHFWFLSPMTLTQAYSVHGGDLHSFSINTEKPEAWLFGQGTHEAWPRGSYEWGTREPYSTFFRALWAFLSLGHKSLDTMVSVALVFPFFVRNDLVFLGKYGGSGMHVCAHRLSLGWRLAFLFFALLVTSVLMGARCLRI